MKVVHSIAVARASCAALRKKGRLGFVPTMGALHEGHLSLVRRARRENKAVIVSVFVNPLQFAPGEDLRRYPRTPGSDRRLLEKTGADLLFVPQARAFYAEDFQTDVKVRALSAGLCGRTRPTHFTGVATVVLKLLNLVRPDTLYLGQKDYQQYRVLAQMTKDLAVPVDVRLCPIVREKDGMAMSSRNVFLSPAERKEARGIHEALKAASRLARHGERRASRLRLALLRGLRAIRHARVDYAQVVDAASLAPVVRLKSGQSVLVAAAVRFSRTRLIDNCLLKAG